jgi:integrase
LRHTFAVRTLINWYRSGADVDAMMASLSTYLGHINASGTYWYPQASPELMELAAIRLDGRFGQRP